MGVHLYWCTTLDHEEDWFVVARSAAEARDAFSAQAGYDRSEVRAEDVCDVPDRALAQNGHSAAVPLTPDLDMLSTLGGEMLTMRSPYVFRFDRELYIEGSPDVERYQRIDDALEAEGRGRPNGTRRKPGVAGQRQ